MIQNLLENLNPEQKEAVLHTDGPVLVLAGAGSGKTRVLSHRVGYLIREKRVEPYKILSVTFTNKAAGEMRERIVSLLGFDSPALWISTFHSAAVRILRREITVLNYPANFVIFDTSEQKTLIKSCMKELNINEKFMPPYFVMSKISAAKNELILPENYPSRYNHQYLKEVVSLYSLYQKKLKQNNALDFDDLIFFVVKLFKKHPDILEKYQELFHYILIDEYQDINKAQYQLVKLLSEKRRNLFVVGDEDQSIYAFRGADMNIILNFEKDFPEAKIIKLQQNYRSTQSILNASNELVRNNRNRRDKELWTDKSSGQKPICHEALDERDEAVFVIDEIKKLYSSNGRRLSDFVILYRTNAQSRVFEEILISEGLSYQIVGGLKFYDRKEIKDILAYLRLMVNPSDTMALKRIINVPTRGIGDRTIEKLEEFSADTGRSLYEILTDKDFLLSKKITPRSLNLLNSFEELIESLKVYISEMKVSTLLEEIMDRTGYIAMLKEQNNVEALTRLENLEELLKVAQEFEYRNPEASLEDFLSLTSLSSDIDMMEENSESITLMTVHSAKGLEFPVVFLTGIEENIFPHERSIATEKESDIEEERRLAYVAVTRAMEKLYLTYAWRRSMYGGGSSYNEPSRFLKEMDSFIERPQIKKDLFDSSPVKSGKPAEKVKDKPKKPFSKKVYSRGDRVKHKEFGQGVVMEVIGSGIQSQLKISFPKVGLRKVDVESLTG